jgi:uncharacterized membrane protein
MNAWQADLGKVERHSGRRQESPTLGHDLMETGLVAEAKIVIEYLARRVEFAAALIIGNAALEATIKSLLVFVRRSAPPEQKNEVRLTLGRWLAVDLTLSWQRDESVLFSGHQSPEWSSSQSSVAA